jgi:hypothetical protein
MHIVRFVTRGLGVASVLVVAATAPVPMTSGGAPPGPTSAPGGAAAGAVVMVTKLRVVRWPRQVGIQPKDPHATWSGRIAQRCSASVAAFSVANTTTAVQTMTLDGAAFVKVAAGADNAVCLWGTGTETFTIGTVGARYVTTLTVS